MGDLRNRILYLSRFCGNSPGHTLVEVGADTEKVNKKVAHNRHLWLRSKFRHKYSYTISINRPCPDRDVLSQSGRPIQNYLWLIIEVKFLLPLSPLPKILGKGDEIFGSGERG
jgi:hypothetical protein